MLCTLYGRITTFAKKENAFERCRGGQTFGKIVRTANMAEVTAQTNIIYMITKGLVKDQHERLIVEMEIPREPFEGVSEMCSRSGLTLRKSKIFLCNTNKLQPNPGYHRPFHQWI